MNTAPMQVPQAEELYNVALSLETLPESANSSFRQWDTLRFEGIKNLTEALVTFRAKWIESVRYGKYALCLRASVVKS